MAGLANVATLAEYDAAVSSKRSAVAYFWAPWCEPCEFLDKVLTQLASEAPGVAFLRVEAEEAVEVSEARGVSAVPLFVFYEGGVESGERVEGPHVAEVSARVLALRGAEGGGEAAASGPTGAQPIHARRVDGHGVAAPGASASALPLDDEPTREQLAALTTASPVVLFMKGNPDAPRCGFSARTVAKLQEAGAEFGQTAMHFDILSHEGVRAGMKIFSNWPTFPQLYVAGEFIGGSDIVAEMAESGELRDEVAKALGAPAAAPEAGTTEERIKKLLASAPVVLFMKGTPDAPRCGFSRKVVEALRIADVDFTTFDILSDEDVRQGLKTFSNWPTYPQLYANGELVGGCDIVLEMAKDGELRSGIDEMLAVA